MAQEGPKYAEEIWLAWVEGFGVESVADGVIYTSGAVLYRWLPGAAWPERAERGLGITPTWRPWEMGDRSSFSIARDWKGWVSAGDLKRTPNQHPPEEGKVYRDSARTPMVSKMLFGVFPPGNIKTFQCLVTGKTVYADPWKLWHNADGRIVEVPSP